jgi:hypothetical protein
MALAAGASAQTPACKVVAGHGSIPAEEAYASGDYMQAETLYTKALMEKPDDERSGAGLVRTLLRERKITEAANRADSLLAAHPESAVLLTALAEVQLRQGVPWLAAKTLERSTAIDPCLALTHLIRSKVDRVDSMYSSERSEIRAAYEIDPTDAEIARAWRQSVSIGNDVVSIDKSIAGSDLDAAAKRQAQVTLKSMLSGLSENSQTCQIVPATQSAVLPLLPSISDGKHIDGFKLEVKLPQTKAVLQVDTAASGLYISRALADRNDLRQAQDGMPGTVYAANVTIGPLEFHECTLGVSDTPFYEKADGYIGTDVFSSYLIKLDQPNQKLELSPLPPVAGTVLPGDRADAAELRGFTPVYHRRQYLLVPVTLNGKERKLFVLDSGVRYTTMPSKVAHAVSTTRLNFTNAKNTTSGATIDVYRDSFDFEFAGLVLRNRGHLVEMESPAIDASIGMKVGGMLGFDMLHSMVMQLDYRDGLIKLEAADSAIEVANGDAKKGGLRARSRAEPECPPDDMTDQPFVTLITAKPTGLWDSGSLKAGESLTAKVVKEWIAPACRLDQGANLYGHVVSVAHSKHHGKAELALVFDQGDCTGHSRQALTLNVIGLLAPEDNRKALHDALPLEMHGGARRITEIVPALSFGTDFDLNPEKLPEIVHPGMVTRVPGVELALHAGPHCSVLLRSSEQNVRVGPKTQLLLTMGASH